MRAHRIQIVDIDPRHITFDAEDAVLADLAVALVRARGAVVVEEAVEARTVDGDGGGVDDAETPAVGCGDGVVAVLDRLVLGEDGVAVAGVVWEGQRCWGVGLVVGCLGLDL